MSNWHTKSNRHIQSSFQFYEGYIMASRLKALMNKIKAPFFFYFIAGGKDLNFPLISSHNEMKKHFL